MAVDLRLEEEHEALRRTVEDFAQREVDFALAVGGIAIETGKALGRDFTLADLKETVETRHPTVPGEVRRGFARLKV